MLAPLFCSLSCSPSRSAGRSVGDLSFKNTSPPLSPAIAEAADHWHVRPLDRLLDSSFTPQVDLLMACVRRHERLCCCGKTLLPPATRQLGQTKPPQPRVFNAAAETVQPRSAADGRRVRHLAHPDACKGALSRDLQLLCISSILPARRQRPLFFVQGKASARVRIDRTLRRRRRFRTLDLVSRCDESRLRPSTRPAHDSGSPLPRRP